MRAIATGLIGTLGLITCTTSVNLACILAILTKIDSYIGLFTACKEPSIKGPDE